MTAATRRLNGAWRGWVAVLYPTYSALMTRGERRKQLSCWAVDDWRRRENIPQPRANSDQSPSPIHVDECGD